MKVRWYRPVPLILWRHLTLSTLGPFLLLWGALSALLLLLVTLRIGELAPAASFGLGDLLPLLGYSLPHLSILTVPVTFLAGLLLAYGQFSADGGYIAARAAGVGPLQLAFPALCMGVVTTAAGLVLTLEGQPWGNTRLRQVVAELAKVGAVTSLKPGAFHDTLRDLTVFVGARQASGDLSHVLLFDSREPKRAITAFAERGHFAVDPVGAKLFTDLEAGELQSLSPDGRVFRRIQFDRYQFLDRRLSLIGSFEGYDLASMRQVIEDVRKIGHPTWRFELALHRKFSLPVAALVFALFGVALGLGRVQAPRIRAALIAVGMVAAYYTLMRAGDGFAARGQLPIVIAAWLPNLLLLPAGVILLWRHARVR